MERPALGNAGCQADGGGPRGSNGRTGIAAEDGNVGSTTRSIAGYGHVRSTRWAGLASLRLATS